MVRLDEKTIKKFRGVGWTLITLCGAGYASCAAMARMGIGAGWVDWATLLCVIVVALALAILLISLFFAPEEKHSMIRCRAIVRDEISNVMTYLNSRLQGMPTIRQIESLFDANKEMFFVIEIPNATNSQVFDIAGCFSLIYLKQGAVDKLKEGSLTGSSFADGNITRKKGVAKGLYIGVLIGENQKTRAFAISELKAKMGKICHRNVLPVFARPITPEGLRLVTSYKFVAVRTGKEPTMNTVCWAHSNQLA